MSPLPAPPATPDTVSAADAEDALLAALAPRLQADRLCLLQRQRRIERLRGLLHNSHAALQASRAELARTRQAAVCDALTGLPNRRGLEPPLRRELAEHAGGPHLLALLFVDRNGFKAVNDRLGHAAGDELLRIVGARLVNGMRRSDLVCRYGGDEFVCLLPRLHSATRAGALAAALLRSIAEPCVLGGQQVRVQASIGVAIYPRDGDNIAALLRSADTAMYAAKSRPGGVAMARPAAGAASRGRLQPARAP
jgi:diguanylate cyclase (GGDEF)-like protein